MDMGKHTEKTFIELKKLSLNQRNSGIDVKQIFVWFKLI